jgi:hypothetical protein
MLQPGKAQYANCEISYQLTTGLPCLICTLLNGKALHYMDAKISPDRVDRRGYPIWTIGLIAAVSGARSSLTAGN